MADIKAITMPNEAFLNKVVIDKNIKPVIEYGAFWENKGIPKVRVDGLVIKYYKEQYADFETPNDAVLGRTLDPKGRGPQFRAPYGAFPHAEISQPKEYTLRLYQLALEMDYAEEEMILPEFINQVQRKTRKLANYFSSDINMILGNAITENWTGSTIQLVTATDTWSANPTASDPVKDILDCCEKLEENSVSEYHVSDMLVARQSLYDLKYWAAKNNYTLGYEKPENQPETIRIEGVNIQASNQIKRGVGLMADFANCGTIYEFAPLSTNKYYTDVDHVWHLQMMRTWNFALTDPYAVCMLKTIA